MNKEGQNILRTFIDGPNKPIFAIRLSNSDYYFTGHSAKYIYLGNYRSKNQILRIDANLKDTVTFSFVFPKNVSITSQNQKIQVCSDSAYVIEKESQSIYKTGVGKNRTLQLIIHLPSYIFDGLAIPNFFVVKEFDTISQQNVFSNYNRTGSLIKRSKQILEKQSDGIISTDGILSYMPESKLFYYTYFYRNQFICFDTSLTVKYRASTIDTNSWAKISLHYLKAGDYTTFNAPPPFVNKTSSISNSWIYIQSTMIARNDTPDNLKDNSVIDVYNIRNGHYRGSFYIPNQQNERIRAMETFSNGLMILQGEYLSFYPQQPF